MPKERRRHSRRPLARAASIDLPQGRGVACTLRNISPAGAMIALDDDMALPPRFVLDLSGNILVQRDCELVWQIERRAGVKFPAAQSLQVDLV